jgi:flagellar M-ring protein FliF
MQSGRFRELWSNLDTKGQLTLVGSLIAIVVLAFVLFRLASQPSYTALATGLDPAEASDVAAALDAAGLGYQIVNGGTQVDVVKGQESNARVALAAEGLPRGGEIGWELFDEQKLGTTDFQQRVNFQRALEGEISRTIEGIEGIRDAQVQLVLPEDELFSEPGTGATAAVLLDGAAGLDVATVRGIAHLVGSSVESLDPQKVTITDSTGSLLWPSGDSTGSIGSTSKLEAEQQYAAQLSALANAMLAKTLGPNKAEVRVHATLNLDQRTIDAVRFADEGTPITRANDSETFQSEGTVPAGVSGTDGNIPGFAAGGGGEGNSSYERNNSTTEFGVDKTVERTVVAPGTVERLDVALLLDDSLTEQADAVVAAKNAVSALVGLDAERGDTLTASTISFAEPPKETAAEKGGVAALLANPIGLLKYVVIGVGSLVFLFAMRRALRRRESEQFAPEPTWLRQIEGAVPLAQLGAGNYAAPNIELPPDPAAERRDAVRHEVEELVKREPEKVAQQVGQWVRE